MNKIKAVVDLLGEDLVVQHIIEGDYNFQVKLAMITSDDNNGVISDDEAEIIQQQGVLSESDKALIASLMP
jgi:predicted metallo-beta-lactamase superfamily hydrolase